MSFIIQFLQLASIFSGLLVITAESPIVSVLYLIVLFICAACYLILAGLPYLGVVYIVVYVGAIAILFIFILMMINLQSSDIIESNFEFNIKLPLTLLLASAFFLEVYYLIKDTYKFIQ
jgi:NADH-ubiquinone oxidoreductase chain 6